MKVLYSDTIRFEVPSRDQPSQRPRKPPRPMKTPIMLMAYFSWNGEI